MNEPIINVMCKLRGQTKVAAREPGPSHTEKCQHLEHVLLPPSAVTNETKIYY